MSFVWASAKKDLRRRLRDPLAFLLWIGIPLVIGGLISFAFGGSDGPKPRARLLVANHDDGLIADLLSKAFGQGQAAEIFEVTQVDEAVGRKRMEAGEASALLVIPEGFGDAVLLEEPSTLVLVTNPSENILPQMVQETLSLAVDGVFYLHRVIPDDLREEMRAFADGPPAGAKVFADERIAKFSARVNDMVRRLGKYLFPPVIRIDVAAEEASKEEKVPLGLLFFPSMLVMALFFVAQGLSDDVWREHAEGTLRRVVTTPQSTVSFLLGKLLCALAILLVIAAAGMVLGWLAFDLTPERALVAALWTAFTGTVLTAFMMLVQLCAKSQQAGHLLTNIVLFPLLMIGGAFFPFEAMPAWMASIGRSTPNGWALEVLKGLVLGRAEVGATAIAFLALLGTGTVLVFLCSLRLARGFAKS